MSGDSTSLYRHLQNPGNSQSLHMGDMYVTCDPGPDRFKVYRDLGSRARLGG